MNPEAIGRTALSGAVAVLGSLAEGFSFSSMPADDARFWILPGFLFVVSWLAIFFLSFGRNLGLELIGWLRREETREDLQRIDSNLRAILSIAGVLALLFGLLTGTSNGDPSEGKTSSPPRGPGHSLEAEARLDVSSAPGDGFFAFALADAGFPGRKEVLDLVEAHPSSDRMLCFGQLRHGHAVGG